jgi:hypothetical protein
VSTLWLSTHYSSVVVFGLLLVFVSWRSLRVALARYVQPLIDRVRPPGALSQAEKVT